MDLGWDRLDGCLKFSFALRTNHYLVQGSGKERRRFLRTANLRRIWVRTYPVEDAIFAATANRLRAWRFEHPSPKAMRTFHGTMAQKAHACLEALAAVGSGTK